MTHRVIRLPRRAAGGWGLGAPLASLLSCAPLGPGGVDGGPGEQVPFAVEVVRFEPGEGAGFGQEAMPDIVLGSPKGEGGERGSLDVVSLGRGGVIELRLGLDAVDGEGADLVIFENPFSSGGLVFAEPGEVAVSADGETWLAFPCTRDGEPPNGCAGYAPVFAHDERGIDATDREAAGGDRFDLAELGIDRARYVRVTDQSTAPPVGPTAGFDLDAVAVLSASRP